MSDNCRIARQILGNLDRNVVPTVNRKAALVEDFMTKLQATLRRHRQDNVLIIDRVHGGSAYENLAVDKEADFDITLVLGDPFISTNFQISRDRSGYFTLKWNSHLREKPLADNNGYLQASKLKEYLFGILDKAIGEIQLPNATCAIRKLPNAIKVIITPNSREEIKVDLVPQIVFRTWGQFPGLKPLQEMPVSLRRYIDTLNKNSSPVMFFSLGFPYTENYQNPGSLFNISFSLLEKRFFTDNTDIRDMVRLAKVVAKRRNWKTEHSFKSFLAKRVAIKYWEELKGKDLWEGYKALLSCVSREVSNGTIDGYFVRNQVMQKWFLGEISSFQMEIATVLEMNASCFL